MTNVNVLPMNVWQEAQAEIAAERNKEAKEKIKKLLRQREDALKVVRNFDVQIEALKLELSA